MYELLLENYEENQITNEQVSLIEKSLIDKEDIQLINFKSLKFILQNFIAPDTDELAELLRCFPDNKFVYYFF